MTVINVIIAVHAMVIMIIVINTVFMIILIIIIMIITHSGRGQVRRVFAPCADGDVQHHGERC